MVKRKSGGIQENIAPVKHDQGTILNVTEQ
jgi:hypothetical protein